VNTARDVKTDLTEYLRELHLPAIRQCFEEKARQAERETALTHHFCYPAQSVAS
jgi:hypothetical protein